ncbi:hypothetical protein ACFY12_17650 [Streptomyces sp. NPDC001339]|uniref:hypothetical protein n=1 Tax=Streptomyces sp. NPDC001339 TaxID=3364563 RepID=UPI0036A05490
MSTDREDDADVPTALRPEVLSGGEAIAGDKAGGFLSFFFTAATNTEPKEGKVKATGDPAARALRQKKNGLFFGEWESLAGRWLAASQPRSRMGVLTVLVLTGSHLRFVYVQRRRGGSKLGDAVAAGEAFPRGQLAWTRRHGKRSTDFQFGFTDGSWGTLTIPDDKYFLELFPGTLGHKDPIP